MGVVKVSYFSDALCIWAYIAQARIDAVKEKFGDTIRLDHRFCSVFGDTAAKITSTWRDKGEYAGFNEHLRNVASRFPHIELDAEIWLETRPPTSTSAHLFMICCPAMAAGAGKRRPKRVSISRRPRLVTPNAILSRSWTIHFLFSATLRRAAPSAPPMWGRRSLQSRHAEANRRRSVRVAWMSMPRTSNAFVPSGVRSYVLSLGLALSDSQPSALKRSLSDTPTLPAM